ncbi:unnamed protein product [Sphagnum balticum]
MKVEKLARIKYMATSYLILVMVLTFAFAAILGINLLKGKVSEEDASNESAISTFLTLLATVVTLVVNTGLGMVVKGLTEYEKH